VIVFGRRDHDPVAVRKRLAKPLHVERAVGAIVVLVVERKIEVQDIQSDPLGEIVAQADQCRARKRAVSQAARQSEESDLGNDLVHP
jgi:hypothetical protein